MNVLRVCYCTKRFFVSFLFCIKAYFFLFKQRDLHTIPAIKTMGGCSDEKRI